MTNFAVGIVTYNARSTLRMDLLEQTVESLTGAFPGQPIYILDNGSDDDSGRSIERMFEGEHITVARRVDAANTTPGAGRNVLIARLVELAPDVVVMSDDDMAWKPGAAEKLGRFFSADPPRDLAIVGGLLEPLYPWNTPRERLGAGGVSTVVRDSVPGAAWAMTPQAARSLPGWPEPFKNDFGYDHDACVRLSEMRMRVCALDLADHLGWGASTHGNRADLDVRRKPLDREHWGV